MDEKQFTEQFHRQVDRLKPDLRTVFILHHIEDLSFKQIKDLLKIPTATIKRRLEAAIRELLAQWPRGDIQSDLQAAFGRKLPSIEVVEIVGVVKQLTPDLIECDTQTERGLTLLATRVSTKRRWALAAD